MPTQIDVYRDWLKIADADRPLNFYQLLRVKKFEDDSGKIRANYRKMNAHVRKYATGEYAQQSQDLLNELARAMLCLTDSGRKSEYDAGLGREQTAGERKTLEQILIARKIVDSAQLAKARGYANTVNVDMHDALIQQKLAPADQVMEAYAESIGLPFVDLADMPVDEELVPRLPAYLARQQSCVPILLEEGFIRMASPQALLPEIEDELRLRLGLPVRMAICTPAQVNEAIGKHFPKDAAIAQMQAAKGKAGGVAAAPSPAARAATATKAATAPAAQPAQPSAAPTAEEKKRKKMIALMTFNFTFLIATAFLYLTNVVLPPPPNFLLSAGIGAVVAGIAAMGATMVVK